MILRPLSILLALGLVVLSNAASARDDAALPRLARILDRPLVDASGRRHYFLSDLLGRGPAILSFTFTGCRALCPVSDLIMDQVAAELRRKGETRIRLLTLTLDPLTDTPDTLRRERAAAMDSSRLFLTGRPDDVFAVLDALGIEGGANQNHGSLVLLIDGGGHRIAYLPGLPDAKRLIAAASGLQ